MAGPLHAGALFSADPFSDSVPRYSPAGPEGSARAAAVLAREFRHLGLTPTAVLQAGGMEINSNNFKVEVPGKAYLLKRLGAAAPEPLRIQLKLLQWLRERGHPVPRLEKTSDDDVLHADGAQAWCLFDFVDGEFFSGATAQLADTARRIGALQKELRALPPALHPPRKWAYFTALEREILAEMETRKADWAVLFGSAHAELLAASWPHFARTAAWLESRRADFEAAPWVPAHCDLHPHNLLMQQDRLAAVVDFESFVLLPDGVSLGYAAYKLLKQHAVSRGGGRWAADTARLFFEALAESDPATGERSRLELFAMAELFRRLLIVFKLTLKDANTRWNHVLPLHLAGLEEIGVIFG